MNSRTGDSYDLSINVELSDNFTSAVRTAVSFFHVTLVSINSLGPVHVFELTDDRLLINNTLFQSERTFFDQRALGDDEQYKLSVSEYFFHTSHHTAHTGGGHLESTKILVLFTLIQRYSLINMIFNTICETYVDPFCQLYHGLCALMIFVYFWRD